MKYSKLIISGIPKSFDVTYAGDYIQPLGDDIQPEDILYDFYFAEADEDKGEEAVYLFKYDESATGIYLVHTPHLQTLVIELSTWASEADVLLYADFINSVLAKHKRAHLYDKYAPLKGLTDDDVLRMIKDRKAYLKRQLTTREHFTMEGLNADFTLQVAHLRPAISPDVQILELQRQFVEMQWEKGE
ncbi:MAG: hypothetical protein IKX65_06520 [Prevotella sp.]|nr:hypothetical protein [Prevotella sp.]